MTGDCVEAMRAMEEASVHAVVTDPPYGLGFTGQSWDMFSEEQQSRKGANTVERRKRDGRAMKAGRYDQSADVHRAFQSWCYAWAIEALRVLKPGGHLFAFGGTRTYHRLMCAIEDAGFEVRDCLMYLYGSGFPKSLDVSKAIDKAERGVPQGGADPTSPNHGKFKGGCSDDNPGGRGFGAGPGQFMAEQGETAEGREPSDAAKEWDGWGTALKPAWEPIIVARKPLIGTVAENVQRFGTGALNIDGSRIGTTVETWPKSRNYSAREMLRPGSTKAIDAETQATGDVPGGRWPANVVLDEWHEPVLRLKYNISDGERAAISEYFEDYRGLLGVRAGVPDVPEQAQEEQRAVLQPGVVRESPLKPDERGRPSDVRKEAQPRGAGEDAEDKGRARQTHEGEEQPSVQRRLHEQGISVGQRGRAGGPGEGAGGNDAPKEPGRTARASDSDGGQSGQAVAPKGVRPSQERRQDGQQTGKPDADEQISPQNGALCGRAGTQANEEGERNLDVLACHVPSCWEQYFEPTGIVVRSPSCSAAMLDGQSGEKVSGSRASGEYGLIGGHGRYNEAGTRPMPAIEGDAGGASRFFYTAKASRADRGEWNTHPTVKPTDLIRWLVNLVTKEGQTVLDPFAGSGTTGVVAAAMGRDVIMVEISPEYVALIERRMAGVTTLRQRYTNERVSRIPSLFGEGG